MTDAFEPVEPGPDAADRFDVDGWLITEPLDPQAVEELRSWIDADSTDVATLLTRGEVAEHGACVLGTPVRLCTDGEPALLGVLAVADLRAGRAPRITGAAGVVEVPLWAGQMLWARPSMAVDTGASGALVVAYERW